MSTFGLIVQGSETRSSDGSIIGREGEWYLVCDDHDGWVEADSMRYENGNIPTCVKKFKTPEIAQKFAKRWKGHPWWCKPNGVYKVISMEPKYETRTIGYKVCL